MELKTMTTRWWVPPKTHPDFEMMTGQHMLETLERIFRELDEMGVPVASVVTCPHGHGNPPRQLVYMGRTLDFCNDCYDLVINEMRVMNDRLKTPAECREKARQFVNRASSPGFMWPQKKAPPRLDGRGGAVAIGDSP